MHMLFSEEEVRLDLQKRRLGENGLRRKKEIIEAAISSQTLPSSQVYRELSPLPLPSNENRFKVCYESDQNKYSVYVNESVIGFI